MLPSQTVVPLFTSVEVYIAIYSKHITVAAAARNLKHIAPCEGKTYQTQSLCIYLAVYAHIIVLRLTSNLLPRRATM